MALKATGGRRRGLHRDISALCGVQVRFVDKKAWAQMRTTEC